MGGCSRMTKQQTTHRQCPSATYNQLQENLCPLVRSLWVAGGSPRFRQNHETSKLAREQAILLRSKNLDSCR